MAVGLLGGTAFATSPDDLLQSFWWTADGREAAAATTQPAACLAFEERSADVVKAGMALFNTPGLLGGQAAKAGLSCGSCHANGRDNEHFQVEGLSSAPGTADVTSSFFSVVRANAVNDAVAIPDLAMPGKISRAAGDPALERFIRILIVEEFSGKEPSALTLTALADYVRSIRVCGNGRLQDRKVDDQISLIDAAMSGALAAQRTGDLQTAKLLISAARHQLGLIDERYPGRQFAAERQSLLESSRRLQVISEANDASAFGASLTSWQHEFNANIVLRLNRGEVYSLYNIHRFREALKNGK